MKSAEQMLNKRFSVQPLYIQLREALTARIASGTLGAGDALPNEVELAREYGLSAGTVRKALDWMEEVRLISRQQGRGTFVVDQTSSELATRYDRLRAPDGSSIVADRAKMSVREELATDEECAAFELPPGANVCRVEQTQFIGGKPFLIEKATLPSNLFATGTVSGMSAYNVVTLARASGVLLGRGEEQICLGSATVDVASVLAVEPGASIALLQRSIFTIEGRPAEKRTAFCNLGDNSYAVTVGS